MQDSAQYKVIDRRKFAVVMVILMSFVAVGVWVSLDYFAEYAERLEELAVTAPAAAAAAATKLTRTLAILNGLVLGSLTTIIIWHGWSSWRSESMPPTGSWILEGQRTWTGESAVRIAKFTIVVGALLGVLGVASSSILWRLGDTIVDEAPKGAYMLGHPIGESACGDTNDKSIQALFVAPALVRCGPGAVILPRNAWTAGSGQKRTFSAQKNPTLGGALF